MKIIVKYLTLVMLLLLILSSNVLAQEAEPTEKTKKSPNRNFFKLTDRDVILPITSIEWGEPDRWSFTARYIHMFGHTKNKEVWKNNLGISISPGWSGGRAGIDYIGIYSPKNMSGEFALFTQFRGVLLRTWGNPLTATPDVTYAGAEVKFCISFLLDLGAGYYYPISGNNKEPFIGFHIGVGI